MSRKLKTTTIKGKEYVEVNERIIAFREESQYKGFALLSEIVVLEENFCAVKATVLNAEGKPVANGHAHETRQASYINKTSMLENCETSAWGRALGNLGIGVDTSIATYEEVEQAIQVQEASKQAPAKQAPSEPAEQSAKGTDRYKKLLPFLNTGTEAQRELCAKLLSSSVFEKEDRKQWVDDLNGAANPEHYSTLVDNLQEEFNSRKNIK